MNSKMPQVLLDTITTTTISSGLGQRALEIFRVATHRVLDRLKQSVLADVIENTKATVIQLTKNLGDKLLQVTQKWNEELNDQLLIYPEGTRFVRRLGTTQIFVIEQPPRIRTLSFNSNYYALAVPYTIFILQFVNCRFENLYMGYRNKPLTNIKDTLYRSNLPNIDDGLHVCVGKSLDGLELSDLSITEQINSVINSFWQSTFNGDISDEYKRISQVHQQFATLKTWAKHTKEDPLFVLNIPWTEAGTLKSQVGRFRICNPNIQLQLQGETMQVVNVVANKLTKALENVEIGTVRSGELTKQFSIVLQDIIRDAYQDCWRYAEQNIQDDRKNMRYDLDASVKKMFEDLGDLGRGSWR